MRKFIQNNFAIILILLFISLVISVLLTICSAIVIKSYPGFHPSFMKIFNCGAAWTILGTIIAILWMMLLSLELEKGFGRKIFSYIFRFFKNKNNNKKLLAELDPKDLTNINSGLSVTVVAQNSGSNTITAGSPVLWGGLNVGTFANPNAVIIDKTNQSFLDRYNDVLYHASLLEGKLKRLRMDLIDIDRDLISPQSDIIELYDFLKDFIMDVESIHEQMKYQHPNAKNISDNNL